MKRKKLFLTLVVIFATLFSAQGALMFDPEDIDVKPLPPPSTDPPRSLSFNPFYAQLDGTCLLLGSTSSCGEVTVLLVSTAGDYYPVIFDTEDGEITIPISGNTGHYVITLTDGSGNQFYGEFTR